MNKGTLISRLVALGAVTSLIAGFGTVGYETEVGANLAGKIEELKNLAITWKQNASAKDQLITQKEQELSALQGKYESILTLLGISDMNADESTIKNAINSLSSEQDLKDIATALGIDSTASKADILDEIRVMGETMTTLKDSIDTLESTVGQLKAEIERLQGEVNKANTAESEMLTAVTNAIKDIGSPTVKGEEEEEEEVTTYCSTHTEIELVDGVCSTCNLAILEEDMNAKWAIVENSGLDNTVLTAVKDTTYEISGQPGSLWVKVNGIIKNLTDDQATALNNYWSAKAAYQESL